MRRPQSSFIAWIVVGLFMPTASIGPRVASREELLETASQWLYDFDENEDDKLSFNEMYGLIEQMRETTEKPELAAQLTPEILMPMADGDADQMADREELVRLLLRMKGFDAGDLDKDTARNPQADANADVPPLQGDSHEERMKKKKGKAETGKAKKGKAKNGKATPKDET